MLKDLKNSPHRNHLEKYLKKHLPKLSGSILDIGSKNRRYDFLMKQRPVAIDLIANKDADVESGDVCNLSFEDSSFENVVCLEVLEYVHDPKKAINEIYRVLKNEGTLILSTPFMYKFHGDRLRYTENFLKESLSDFKSVEIFSVGNAYTVLLNILFGKIKHIKFSLFRYIALALYLPLTFFNSNKIYKGGGYNSGYFIIAKK